VRRGPLTWIAVAVVGVVLVLAVTALIGNRDSRGETVTAGEWAQNVCGSVAVWRGELEAIIDEVQAPSSANAAVGEEPQSETPQGRTAFIRKGLDRTVQAAEVLVEGVDNAGIPDTPEGEAAARQMSDWVNESSDDLEQAQDSLDDEADTLEEGIEQLTGAARTIASVRVSGLETLNQVVSTDPALGAALEASSTCQQLREETS
jgi:uncharacterized phage infection (PIP) family protein YhgE